MGDDNLIRMQAIDQAWNERDWEVYSSFFAHDLSAYANDSIDPRGKAEHVSGAEHFCAKFPDAVVHEPYLDEFASADGIHTCTISKVTGCPAIGGPAFNITMAIVSRWRDGLVIHQRQYLDEVRMGQQLAREHDQNGL